MMKIAYVTTYDVRDEPAWVRKLVGFGGAGYYFARALERLSVNIHYLGPLKTHVSPLGNLKRSFYQRLYRQRYHPHLTTSIYRSYARQVKQRLDEIEADIVLSQESGAIAYLECKQPVVLWTDAPYAAQFGFYDFATGLCRETRQSLDQMERAALSRASLVVYASDWAARAAIQHYQSDEAKVKVIPWGANLEVHSSPQEIDQLIQARPHSPCKLLFCGLDWDRKRGAVTIDIAEDLNRRGIPTELTLIGATPRATARLPAFVKCLGFIDISTPEGRQRMRQALAAAHFLLLPSLAETFGHVLCEANAFGVPCLATAVGGIPTVIRDGVNGRTYPVNAGVADYSIDIATFMRDQHAYRELAQASFAEFQSRLNYDAAARAVKTLMEPLVRRGLGV